MRAIKECQSRQGVTVRKWEILTCCSMELKKGIHISSISMVAARASEKGMSEEQTGKMNKKVSLQDNQDHRCE